LTNEYAEASAKKTAGDGYRQPRAMGFLPVHGHEGQECAGIFSRHRLAALAMI
jgi:hypothetical protein